MTQPPGTVALLLNTEGRRDRRSLYPARVYLKPSACSSNGNAEEMKSPNAAVHGSAGVPRHELLRSEAQNVRIFPGKCSGQRRPGSCLVAVAFFMTNSFTAVAETRLKRLHPIKNLHCFHFLLTKPPGEHLSGCSCSLHVHPPLHYNRNTHTLLCQNNISNGDVCTAATIFSWHLILHYLIVIVPG